MKRLYRCGRKRLYRVCEEAITQGVRGSDYIGYKKDAIIQGVALSDYRGCGRKRLYRV